MNDEQKNEINHGELLRQYAGTSWMYFVAKPRCETRLLKLLQKQNIPGYLPLIQKTTEYSHRVYTRKVPMFPGYVFASTRSQGFNIGELNSALLKVNFLSETAAEHLLSDLKLVQKYEQLSKEHKVAISPEITPGTPVLIRHGKFKGDYAIVERRANSNRVIINLQWVQMSLHIELPLNWVEVR